MSEFKYACPVCGQHMVCDTTQAGSVVDCPRCFQKIIIPQAPADADQKLILTGTKVGDRPPPKTPELNPYAAKQVKGSSGAVVVIIILVCISAAAAFVYHGTIFKSKSATKNPTPTNTSPVKSIIVAPAANDTNWALNLEAVAIPASPAAGRIHAQDFIVARAVLYNGTLVLRDDSHGPLKFGATINFSGASPDALSGKTINVTTNASTAARVTLHWQTDADTGKESFESGYALRLEFGALTNSRLPGKIFLCTPDAEKSYLAGTFDADAHKPKPKKTQQ